jgi:hypothetical protein
VKANDPLAAAAVETHLSEADVNTVKVRGAHAKAEGPVHAGLQALHASTAAEGPVAKASETVAPEERDATPDKAKRRTWRLVPLAGAAAALTAGLGGGAAYAYFTSTGSGTGHASTGSASGITVTAVASPSADSTLYPGGTGSAVHFIVNNPNPYQVSFTRWSGATLSGVTPVGANTCTTGDFQIASASGSFSPTLTIAANTPSSPGVAGTAAGVLQLKTSAQNGCQGAKVTVTLTLTGGKSS